jgi:uncharacterized iron-regulated membrane protein
MKKIKLPPFKVALRHTFLFIHLWLGLIVGLYFTVAGISGSVITFREELEVQFVAPERGGVTPPNSDAHLMPLSDIVAGLRKRFPEATDAEFAFFNPPQQAGGAYLMRLTDEGKALATTVNPYTGEVIRRFDASATWVNWVDDLHTDLLLHAPGKLANGYLGLLSGVILLSGIWLWWPATIRQIKLRMTIKKGAGAQRVISDLHNILGIYPFLILLVVTLTGSMIVFYQPVQKFIVARGAVVRMARPPKVALRIGTDRLPMEKLLKIGEGIEPQSNFVFIMYPTAPTQPFYVYKRSPTGLFPDSRIYIDPYNGKILQIGSDNTDPGGKKIMRSASTIHFGRWGSMVSKILYFFLGLIPLGLFVTGGLMYIRRRKSKIKQKKRRKEAALAEVSTSK